jgi:nucleoside-diphosphate-sugar epimerase
MSRVVAVTGAAGFLGQALVNHLAEQDETKFVLALDTERALGFAEFGSSPRSMAVTSTVLSRVHDSTFLT